MAAKSISLGGVPEEAFLGFQRDLTMGAWGGVHAPATSGDGPLDPTLLDGLGVSVLLKLRLQRALAALQATVTPGEPLAALDDAWDLAQRRLDLWLELAAVSAEAPVAAAAGRLRTVLLPGTGRAQTQLPTDAEVDFGLAQGSHAKEPAVKADIATVKAQSYMTDIATATEALAVGVGRSAGTHRAISPRRRQRAAMVECRAAFSHAHDTLVWLLDNTMEGTQRARYDQMLAPLTALAARSPTPAGTAAPAPAAGAVAPHAGTPTGGPGTPAGGLPVPTPGGVPAPGTPEAAAYQGPAAGAGTAPTPQGAPAAGTIVHGAVEPLVMAGTSPGPVMTVVTGAKKTAKTKKTVKKPVLKKTVKKKVVKKAVKKAVKKPAGG